MRKTLILGVGNEMRRDDGVGIEAVRRLDRMELGPAVKVVSAGTAGHRLLTELGEVDRLIIVDAVKAGATPGSIIKVSTDEIADGRVSLTSLHQMDLHQVLSLAEALGILPETTILGMQAQDMELSAEGFSPTVEEALPLLIDKIVEEIECMN